MKNQQFILNTFLQRKKHKQCLFYVLECLLMFNTNYLYINQLLLILKVDIYRFLGGHQQDIWWTFTGFIDDIYRIKP